MPGDFEANLFLVQIYTILGRDEDAAVVGRKGENAERELTTCPEIVRAAYLGANYLAMSGDPSPGS